LRNQSWIRKIIFSRYQVRAYFSKLALHMMLSWFHSAFFARSKRMSRRSDTPLQ